jgi:tetratricopeptide (TPR) repeat protein
MDEQNQNFKAYFDKILEIQQQQQNRSLSELELHDIALSLGVSESDWQFIQKVFNNHRTRALGYLKFNNWQDAIPEFEQALTLKPIDIPCLNGMASAYKLKWQSSGDSKDSQLAENYAKQCLEIQPDNQDALKLISQLKQKPSANTSQPTASKSSSKAATRLGWLGVLGASLVGFFTYLFVPSESTGERQSSDSELMFSDSSDQYTSGSEDSNQNEGQIPVEFVNDAYSENIEFITENSSLSDYNESYNYEYKGELKIKGVEIDKLKFKVELIDTNGNVVAVANEEVIQDYMPIFRSGDIVPVHFSVFKQNTKAPSLQKVKMTITDKDIQASNAKFEPSPEISVNWSFKKPANFDIKLRERNNAFAPIAYLKGKTRHNLVIEVENTGNSTIQALKLEIQWLDANGKVLESRDNIINYSSMPKIKPGQTRLDWFIETLAFPDNVIKGYKLNVVSIE